MSSNSPFLIRSTTLYQSREKYFVFEDCFPSDMEIAAALSSPTKMVKSLFDLRRGVGMGISMSQISKIKFLSHAFSLAHNTTAMVSASAEDSATRVEQDDFQSMRLPMKKEHCPRVDIFLSCIHKRGIDLSGYKRDLCRRLVGLPFRKSRLGKIGVGQFMALEN